MKREAFFVHRLDFGRVGDAVQEILREVRDGKLDDELRRNGLKRPAVSDLEEAVSLEGPGAGLSPEAWVKIIVVFGPVAADAMRDLWRVVVLPRLRRRFGSDAVRRDDPHQPDA